MCSAPDPATLPGESCACLLGEGERCDAEGELRRWGELEAVPGRLPLPLGNEAPAGSIMTSNAFAVWRSFAISGSYTLLTRGLD
jgi:hypothetical protein